MIMNRLFAGLMVIVLAGCSSNSAPAVVRVEVPVLVPCVIEKVQKTEFAVDNLDVDAGIWNQMSALRANRLQRKAYESVLEAAIKSCQ
jgi:hypothetical protein